MATPVRLLARVLCLASLAGSVASADVVVSADKPDIGRPYGSAVAPVRGDRPQITDEMIVESKRRGQDLILDQVIARAPEMVLGATPNYRYIRGRALPMALRTTELGVMVEGKGSKEEVIARAVAAARAAGLSVAEDGHNATNNWARLRLELPLRGLAGADAAIEQVLKSPGVAMASPVFENPFIETGYYMPTDRVLVRVKPGADALNTVKTVAGEFEIANPSLGKMEGAMTLRSPLRNGFQVLRRTNELFESNLFAWASPAAIETMEMHVFTPNDPRFLNEQWVHRNTGIDWFDGGGNLIYNGLTGFDMNTDRAWDITRGISSTRVFVMDSGVQTDHPDYDWVSGRDFTTGAVNGVGSGGPGNSCDNHGTAVAGCAAGLINNGVGIAGTGGACGVMSGKIGDQQASPCSSRFAAYSSEWLVNALDWGRDNGAKVTNASIGVGQDDAIEAMYSSTWTSGLLHFASAGNGGDDSVGDNGSGFPGSAPFTISVIAVDPDGTKSSFSNFGTNCDLSAGGTFVRTTDRTGSSGYNGNSGTSGDYTYFSGTSAASPLAAGVALLFFSQHGFATPSQARTAIFNSCTDIGTPGQDTTFQRGHVNAFAALIENAPANDSCTSPNIINPNGGNVVYRWIMDTTWATPSRLEPTSTCASTQQNTVFFRFTADHDGSVTIHTAGSEYDTVLSVFSGCPGFDADGDLTSSPTAIACNDDFGGAFQSQVTVSVEAGQTILIKVGKFGAISGGGTLDFNFAFDFTVPSNDLCQNATVITDPETGSFTFNPPVYDVFHASSSSCEPDELCVSSVGRSVYYRFNPQHDGVIDIDTVGSSYDTVLSIHSGCTTQILQLPPNPPLCLQPQRLACNDDAAGNLQARITDFPVSRGVSYLIKVSRFGTSATTSELNLNFNLSYTRTVPANNACSTATEIPGENIPGGITNFNPPVQDVYYAGTSTCDPDASCIRGDEALFHSVWFEFRPEFNGAINVNTVGSGYDTVLVIQSGCASALVGPQGQIICIGGGTQLRCSDNISLSDLDSQILSFRVNAQQSYFFMVASKQQFTPASQSLLNFNFQYAADACAADYNGDGNLDPDDLSDFIACYFSQPPCPGADFNNDNNTDPDDLSDFIALYFAGC